MATHGPLQLRFCTYCGAYGRHKACHLKNPCPLIPSKAGKQALVSMDKDINPGFRNAHTKEPKGVRHLGKCSFLKLRKAKMAYTKHKARLKSIVKCSLEDGRKRKMDESLVPPSFPPPPIPDFVQARSRAKANTKLQKSLASKECALCWPLGAAEIGVCICSDLALVNVQTAASSSGVVRASGIFPNPAVTQPSDCEIISDTVTTRRSPQETSTCPRCWPLGAASLGYCICDDLAIAGILPPASGNI